MTATVVLIPGAWHGAWCFDRVVPRLRELGVPTIAIDLPGHGDNRGPFTDLHGDAARVRSVLDGVDDGVILLGHSYGGAVITEAGIHDAVSHLVYLCAFALDAGESCAAAAVAETATLSYEGRPNLAHNWETHPDGSSTLTPEGAARCLYNDCDEEIVAWAVAHLGPQPMANLRQSPTAQAWRDRPSTYVVCSDDQTVHPGLQRELAKRCATTLEWPTSHSPFASQPELLISLLSELATQDTR